MASRLRPLETAGLYLLVFGFSIFFFVAGVMVGRWLPREAAPPATVVTLPEKDSEEDLGIYREMGAGRDEPEQGIADPSDPSDPSAPPSSVPGSASNPANSQIAPAQASAPDGPSYFTVQVGAFSDIRAVNQLVLRLGAKGYPQRVIEPGEQGNQAYLIWVDSFDSRAGAASIEERLKADGFATFVKQVPGTPAP